MEYISVLSPIDVLDYQKLSDEEFFGGYEEICDENSEYNKWLKENCPF